MNKKFNMTRRKMLLVSASGLICPQIASSATAFKQQKLSNNFYQPQFRNEFSLGFTIEANASGTITTDNNAFSIDISTGEVAGLQLQASTYRKKSKPLKAKLNKGMNAILLCWKSAGVKAKLQLFVNGKAAGELSFHSRTSRHASPMLRHFSEVDFGKLKVSKICALDFALNKEQVTTLDKASLAKKNTLTVTDKTIGPYIGQVDVDKACIWMRAPEAGSYKLTVRDAGKKIVWQEKLSATVKDDLTLNWKVLKLKPKQTYSYEVDGHGLKISGEDYHFTSAHAENKGEVRLLFGSCADIKETPLYKTIAGLKPDMVYFMGDTPYIDHGDLEVQRHSHRQFLRIPSFQKVLKSTSFVGTWDDHDFGLNDSDGRFRDKNNSIKSFKEYRPQFEHGDNKGNGIYTKVRSGPVEVFVIDARWFSYTEQSHIDPNQKTLLGKTQWQWLKKELKASTASFKILACGIIWDDKKNGEKDDWETYNAERKALFEFISQQKISGVSLMGGDIHVSRLLKYSDKNVGYPLYQFISSPMHGSTIESLNVKHPALKWSALEKNTLLLIDIDHDRKDPTLKASFMNKKGQAIHSVEMTLSQLTSKGTDPNDTQPR
jgi:alkaline phosphatase D